MNKAFATLKIESPFYSIFPGGSAPILPLGPEQVELQGQCENRGYMLDVARCTEEQIDKLAQSLADFFGSRVDEVKAFIMTEKRLPIRANQVERVEGTGIDLRMFV